MKVNRPKPASCATDVRSPKAPGGDDTRFPSHPVDRDADYADGQNDVRHRLVFSGYWNINYFKDSSGLAKVLLNDWSLSWIATAYSGYPYSERIVNDANNDGNRNNDLVPGSRDSHRLPWTKNIDMRLSKNFAFANSRRLELIAEVFNLTNTPQFSTPENRQTSQNFLRFVQMDSEYAPRRVQLGARVTF